MSERQNSTAAQRAPTRFYAPGAWFVKVTDKCNQNCRFCLEKSGAPWEEHNQEQMKTRIQAARKRTDFVAFGGGEPTLDRNLCVYLEHAARLNFRTIRLDTNGLMLYYPDYSRQVVNAGVTHVSVLQVSHDSLLSDGITNCPGAWKLADRGIASLAEAGVETAIRIPLLNDTAPTLDAHVAFIGERYPHVKEVFLWPCPETPLAIEQLEFVVLRALRRAALFGIRLTFIPGRCPPPCVFTSMDELALVFDMPPVADKYADDNRRACAFEECYLAHYCSGLDERAFHHEGDLGPPPSISVAGRILKQWPSSDLGDAICAGRENEFILSPVVMKHGIRQVEEVLLRVNYTCNERCLFCWIDPCFRDPGHRKVLSYIKELKSYRVGTVCLTGGEPTLNRRLTEYVKLLKNDNIRSVWLQTNAVLLQDAGRVEALAAAGLDAALVSLHSHDPGVSDMLTGLPGGFEKTVKGVDNLKHNGVTVFLSHVINAFNFRSLASFVKFADEVLEKTPIVFSFAAPVYGAMMSRGLITKLTAVKTDLKRALDLCYERGVPFSGLSSMCGVPLCILDANPRYYPDAKWIRQNEKSRDMVKADACKSCGLSRSCHGLRRNYADYYGSGELRPMPAGSLTPKDADAWNIDFMKELLSKKFN